MVQIQGFVCCIGIIYTCQLNSLYNIIKNNGKIKYPSGHFYVVWGGCCTVINVYCIPIYTNCEHIKKTEHHRVA